MSDGNTVSVHLQICSGVFQQAGVYSRTLSEFFLEEGRHEHP
jgi:hypothetical protein